ncbi:MAG: ROK family protein [Chloroflexota bacterium]|nr:ROK family protein [Chloroflexota bacterium]
MIGVDIGGTKTALLATDVESGENLARSRIPTSAEAGPEVVLDRLIEASEEIAADAERDMADLAALGIAVPGQVEPETGKVIRAGNLSGWEEIELRDLLRHRLDVPAWVSQDANAAVLGERWRGGAKAMHNVVFLALGTGIGAGVMVNGRVRHGFHYSAGEAGNFLMGREFLGQERDGHGNLEQLIGGPAIRAVAEASTGETLSAAEALARADQDPRLAELADSVADYLAMLVLNITALLDPEAIFLGGGTASAGDALVTRVRERVSRESPVVPRLLLSELGEDAQLHGAVFGALWELDPDLALREELR